MVTRLPVATLEVAGALATFVLLATDGREVTFLLSASDVVEARIFTVNVFCLKLCTTLATFLTQKLS